jgi:WD repeat-containing protein 24
MDRLPIAHTGPILALDWSSAASSTKSRAREDGGVGHGDDGVGGSMGMGMAGGGAGGVGGGAGLSSAGWIVSAGLDRTVKVRPTYIPTISNICILILNKTPLDMGRIPLAHPA